MQKAGLLSEQSCATATRQLGLPSAEVWPSPTCAHDAHCVPPALAGAGATPEGSEAGEAPGGPLAAEDRQLIRQELLLGHLLTLAASSGAVPPHALPSIAGMLQAEGLLPKWLAFTLTQQPALFDRAFHRVFHQVGWLLQPGCWQLLLQAVGEAASSSMTVILPRWRHAHLPSPLACLHLLLPPSAGAGGGAAGGQRQRGGGRPYAVGGAALLEAAGAAAGALPQPAGPHAQPFRGPWGRRLCAAQLAIRD